MYRGRDTSRNTPVGGGLRVCLERHRERIEREDVRGGCKGIHTARFERGKIVSYSLAVWKEEGEDRKGRFVVNFHKQSKQWPKGILNMEKIPSFAVEMERVEFMFSFDIK